MHKDSILVRSYLASLCLGLVFLAGTSVGAQNEAGANSSARVFYRNGQVVRDTNAVQTSTTNADQTATDDLPGTTPVDPNPITTETAPAITPPPPSEIAPAEIVPPPSQETAPAIDTAIDEMTAEDAAFINDASPSSGPGWSTLISAGVAVFLAGFAVLFVLKRGRGKKTLVDATKMAAEKQAAKQAAQEQVLPAAKLPLTPETPTPTPETKEPEQHKAA